MKRLSAQDDSSTATTNANITSGSVTGITDLAVADGGTGASTAAAAATNLGLGTGDSPQHTAINLGHASDTTLSRDSAGVLAVEGVVVPTVSSTSTLTNKTLTAPKIVNGDAIFDANGNEIVKFYSGASAVNQLVLQNGATGAGPAIYPEGGDTNAHLDLYGLGTGFVRVNNARVATTTETLTLTNKRVEPRVSTTTSSATPTINTDNVDMYGLTAQTVDITSFTTNLSGTPTNGQRLWIYIVGTAARAITWGASFEASTVALPTTTVSTNRLDVGFVWNAATSKWRCMASG